MLLPPEPTYTNGRPGAPPALPPAAPPALPPAAPPALPPPAEPPPVAPPPAIDPPTPAAPPPPVPPACVMVFSPHASRSNQTNGRRMCACCHLRCLPSESEPLLVDGLGGKAPQVATCAHAPPICLVAPA